MSRFRAFFLWGGMGAVACEPSAIPQEPPQPSPSLETVGEPGRTTVPPETSAATPPVPEPVEVPPKVASWHNFPLWERVALPHGARVPVPVGQELLDAAVHPTGSWTLVLTRDADRDNVQWHRWTYTGPLESIPGPDLGEAMAYELAWDPLDGGLYVLRSLGGRPGIVRCDDYESGACEDLIELDGEVSTLRAPMARWNDKGRVFATLAENGQQRVVSVRSDGSGSYDLTHPSGKVAERTNPERHERSESDRFTDPPPGGRRVSNAALLDIDPASGTAWLSTDDGLRRLIWSPARQNWDEHPVTASGTASDPHQVRISRNGRFRVEATDASLRLVDRDGTSYASTPIDPGSQLLDLGATGRCALLRTPLAENGLSIACFEGRAARIRHLDSVPQTSVPDLLQYGLAYERPAAEGLYEVEASVVSGKDNTATYVSVDGMLSVLHAGVRGVFLDGERTRTAPALKAFLHALEAAKVDDDSVFVARVGLHVLSDGLSVPSDDPTIEAELARIRTGEQAESPLYGAVVNYADHRPQGPYLEDPRLERLWVARSVVLLLKPTHDVRIALARRPEVAEPWSAWVNAQAPFLMGTRQGASFAGQPLPAWMEEDCLPVEQSLRLYPSAWGPDSEAIERLTSPVDRPDACGVPLRFVPSGLDLLAAMGGATAESILLTSPEGRYPQLPERLAEVKRRGLHAPGIVGAWLHALAVIARTDGGPAEVDLNVWQRRLFETSLSSWVDLRHPLGRASKRDATPARKAVDGGLETLELEPPHVVLDPLPEVWEALSVSFEKLSARVDPVSSPFLSELLADLASTNRDFAGMTRRQLAGEALSPDDYSRIEGYLRDVEGPLRQRLAPALAPERRGRILQASLDSAIVGVHVASPLDGPQQHFHIATGMPRPVSVLLEDRGVSVAVQGAVGSYYEVLDSEPVDDAAWRPQRQAAPRPHWLNPDR